MWHPFACIFVTALVRSIIHVIALVDLSVVHVSGVSLYRAFLSLPIHQDMKKGKFKEGEVIICSTSLAYFIFTKEIVLKFLSTCLIYAS